MHLFELILFRKLQRLYNPNYNLVDHASLNLFKGKYVSVLFENGVTCVLCI